jgi:excisionase family DNA binding protein
MALKDYWLTIAETSGVTNLSGETIRRLIVSGDLDGERAGGWTWLVSRRSVDRYLASRDGGDR